LRCGKGETRAWAERENSGERRPGEKFQGFVPVLRVMGDGKGRNHQARPFGN